MIVVCDYPLEYEGTHFTLRNVKWEREVAIEEMSLSHVGLMPLNEGEASEGKCGFKLIQYLSAAMPVVGSAVGMNKMIITDACGRAVKGFKADDWCDAILYIIEDKDKYCDMSRNAYERWEEKFSYSQNMIQWQKLLQDRN